MMGWDFKFDDDWYYYSAILPHENVVKSEDSPAHSGL